MDVSLAAPRAGAALHFRLFAAQLAMEAAAAAAAAPMPPEPCEAARLAAIGLGVALAFALHEGNQGALRVGQAPKEPVLVM